MSSMDVDRVKVFPPEPTIWMCLSAFKKASVILGKHTKHIMFDKYAATGYTKERQTQSKQVTSEQLATHMVSMMLHTLCW